MDIYCGFATIVLLSFLLVPILALFFVPLGRDLQKTKPKRYKKHSILFTKCKTMQNAYTHGCILRTFC